MSASATIAPVINGTLTLRAIDDGGATGASSNVAVQWRHRLSRATPSMFQCRGGLVFTYQPRTHNRCRHVGLARPVTPAVCVLRPECAIIFLYIMR
jgi:hypothetical protein